MAGNVSERCHDFFKEHTTLTVTDPVNVAGSHPSGDYLIGRGGQGGGAASTLRGAAKSSGAITGGYKYTGFRCVRTQ